jgi:hypothetical protein
MSKPRKSEREAFKSGRLEDILSAANNGHGWRFLADKWGVSRPRAFQWAHENVAAEVCEQIGRHGVRTSGNHKMKRKYELHTAHDITRRYVFGSMVPRFTNCIEVNGWTGRECGQPTEDGAQRCEACRMKPKPRASKYSSAKTVFADG